MLDLTLQIVLWGSITLLLHTLVLYPLSLRLLPRKYDLDPPEQPDNELPSVALLIAAYNESLVIARKIGNSFAQDYPQEKLEIIVGSDGSTDGTDEIVKSFVDPRLRLVRLDGRNGKPLVLNRLVAETQAEIVVITDADVELDSQILRKMCRHFADPRIGVVSCGWYIMPVTDAVFGGEGEQYAAHINVTKALESQVGGVSGGTGMCLAIRHSLYQPFAPGSANDDTTPMLWAVLAGKHAVWDPNAKAYEHASRSFREEFRRRIRIGAGNFQTLARYWRVLLPRYGIAAYTFTSHKAIRWTMPFLMIAILVTSLVLAENSTLYRGVLVVQLIGYAIAALGALLVAFRIKLPPVTSLFHFVAMNAALFLGFFRYLKQGDRKFVWEPTART